ncbi:hypothetical protein KR52_03815 [Synechococcus sp. KORDI-52]|nr:hypothetical protein KR52_03815 [Synechococcus sp. KORDI-52]
MSVTSKLILSLDGGGIRGAASARFLKRVEEKLEADHNKSLRDCVDFYAGTSTGSIIALALATTDLSTRKIDELYSYNNASEIFARRLVSRGYSMPKYKASGKTRVLRECLGDRTINSVEEGKHILVMAYSLEDRRPKVIKSTKDKYHGLAAYQAADASSAAPTFFPTKEVQLSHEDESTWLVDGGVTANNPTMCAIAEAKRTWKLPLEQLKVVSIGTGHRSKTVDGKKSQRWGAIGWFTRGKILDILSDEHVVAYQAITIAEPGSYIRVDSQIKYHHGLHDDDAPKEEMDEVTPENITKLRNMGEFWFQQYGDQVVNLLVDQYKGESLDRINYATGKPIVFPGH